MTAFERCIDSVLEQSYSNFEIVVTDDSTSNDTEQLINSKYQGKLTYKRNSPSLGSPENWNEVIRLAKGDYIKMLHHDDWFSSNTALSSFAIAIQNARDKPSLIFSNGYNIYPEGKKKKIIRHKNLLQRLKQHPNPSAICYYNWIGAPSMMCIKKDGAVSFDKNSKWFVDSIFYYEYLQQNGWSFTYIDQCLLNVTAGNSQQVTNSLSELDKFNEAVYMFRKCTDLKKESNKFIFRLYMQELCLRYNISKEQLLNSFPELTEQDFGSSWWRNIKMPYQFFAALRFLLVKRSL